MAGPMPPVPNCLLVQVQGTIPGEVWENTYHFGYIGPPPNVANTITFAANIGSLWAQHLTPVQNTDVVANQVTVTDMGSTTGAAGTAVINSPGTRPGGMVPANAAVLCSFPSPQRFRGGHFRSYLLAGVSSDMVNAMEWTTGLQTAVQTGLQAFLSTVIGISVAGTQISTFVGLRRHGKFLPNGGPPNYVLTTPEQLVLSAQNFVVHQQIASQKGRIGRRSK